MQAVSELTVDLQFELGDESGGRSGSRRQVEDTIYRVIQEALANVVKHSGATQAHVRVQKPTGRCSSR